jgi:hypothetical protein
LAVSGIFRIFECNKNLKDMSKTNVILPDSFIKGLVCKVHVSKDGKQSTKELKVCTVKARTISFIEVDRANRKNIFRKVNRKDIVEFRPTAICELTIRDGVLPDRWESSWDSIGQPTQQIRGRGLASQFTKHFSNHSKGWAPKLPPVQSTTNSAAGFPMV